MQHKTLDAQAQATETGEFTAIAAAYSVDRGNERIIPGAFGDTIDKWRDSGKSIPLHWDHSSKAADIIGYVDPASMQEVESGLQVSGKLDLENSAVAKEAWRAMKSNSMGLSFGYMVTDGGKAKDGVYELKSVDLYEISVTPAPMNPDTYFLSLKSVTQMSEGEIRDEVDALKRRLDEMSLALGEAKNVPNATDQAVEDATDEEPIEAKSTAQDPLKQASRDVMLEVLSGGASCVKYVEVTPEPAPEPPSEDSQFRRFVDLSI